MRVRYGHLLRRPASAFLGIVGVLWSSAALADDGAKADDDTIESLPEYGKCYARAAKVVIADDESGAVSVPAYSGFVTKISLGTVKIKQVHQVGSMAWAEQLGDHAVNASLMPNVDQPANVAIDTESGESLSVILEPVASADLANSSLEVVREPKEDVCRAMVQTALENRERDRAKAKPLDQRKERARLFLGETHKDPRVDAPAETMHVPGQPRAVISRVYWFEDEPYMRFTFKNPTSKPYKIAMVHLIQSEQDGVTVHAEFGDNVRREPGVLAIVEPHGEIEGMVLVPDGADVDTVSLRFFGPNATRPVMAARQIWYADPVPPHEAARRERMSQIAVSVGLVGGAMWLGDGTNQGLLEATGLGGFSVRIQRGYEQGFAVEGEFVGGRTSEARFDGVDWGGTQGDITRRVSLGRLLGGVAMRFGYDWVFTGRAGLGFQGAMHDAEFIVGGNTTAGPGDGFEFDMMLYGGAGLDAHVGENWALGVTLEGGGGLFGDTRVLDVGLRLSYGWAE